MNKIQIHFDGDIATNHQVSMRVLGRSLTRLQAALDRAYIDNKHGEVWKHARMSAEDYKVTEFLVQPPLEGGYILDFLSDNPVTKAIIDRVSGAVNPAFEKAMEDGEKETFSIAEQIDRRSAQVNNKIIDPIEYETLVNNPSRQVVRKYGDRSINKEIDQLLSLVRSKHSGESSIELILHGSKSHTFTFDQEKSIKFHDVVSKRELGEPVIYHARVSSLDHKAFSGKILNVVNGKTANIFFHDESGFMQAKEYLGEPKEMCFIGCPLIEYGSYDPNAGDIYFLDLA